MGTNIITILERYLHYPYQIESTNIFTDKERYLYYLYQMKGEAESLSKKDTYIIFLKSIT